jgi:guanylate kinase
VIARADSCAGKTTLCMRLRREFNIGFSVSYTTRQPRPGETEGIEYHFVSHERFQEMAAADEFAEYAMVHGNMYGTAARQVGDALAQGRDLLFDIDFQGGRQLRQRFPGEVMLAFILPPSLRELERRLRQRGTDADEVIARRLKVARSELEHYDEYDYLIVNDDLDRAYDALRAIYVAACHRAYRQASIAEQLIEGQEELPW